MSAYQDETEGFIGMLLVILGFMIVFCIFGMFKSCQYTSQFETACEQVGGKVKWGGRGGDDMCFSADGRLVEVKP